MSDQKIEVTKNGPYIVHGNVNLVRKADVTSEYGEPITWKKTAVLENEEDTYLCRCGHSANKPYCDDSHLRVGFDGTETAATDTFEERKLVHEGSNGIVIKRDHSLCADAGFCGNRIKKIKHMAHETNDSIIRAQVIAMIERCPSGSFSYAMADDQADIEPDLPVQIAVTTEMTSEGPIAGPLWVTGYIPVERSDGEPMEIRNRVTLCRCGQSKNKPLCDGTHRAIHFQE
jgi:CDGSH-type Zn-finger protein